MWFRIVMLTPNGTIRSAAGPGSPLNLPQSEFSLYTSGDAGVRGEGPDKNLIKQG